MQQGDGNVTANAFEVAEGQVPMTQRIHFGRIALSVALFSCPTLAQRPGRYRGMRQNEVRAALEAAIFEAVDVVRIENSHSDESLDWDGRAIAWDVAFLSVAGDLDAFGCHAENVTTVAHGPSNARCKSAWSDGTAGSSPMTCPVTERTAATSNPLTGSFGCGSGVTPLRTSSTTPRLSKSSMLENVAGIGDVEVQRRYFDRNGGVQWLITFLAPADEDVLHFGDVEPLEPLVYGLSGTQAQVAVDEVVRGSYLGGTFISPSGERHRRRLRQTLQKYDVQTALENCCLDSKTDIIRDVIKKGTSYHVDYPTPTGKNATTPVAKTLWLREKTWAWDGVAIGRNGVQYGEQASEPKSVNVTRTTLLTGYRWAVTFMSTLAIRTWCEWRKA